MGRRSSTLAPSQPRWDDIIKSGRSTRRRAPWSRIPKIAFYVLMFLLVFGLVGGGVYAYIQVKLKGNSDPAIQVDSRPPDEPMNVLMLGSDTRDVLTEEERKTFGTISGRRTDTIILIHLDEKRKKAVLVSFPRDLRVRLPNGKQGRINTIYQAGPDAFMDSISEITGLPIHHYVEVNFVGFRNIVNTLGGINVYFERPLKDTDSGLNVPKGCVELKGDQALAFVRVRKIDNDFERIGRQQLFLKLMMDKVTSSGTFLNPVKLVKLVNEGSRNVKTDAELGVKDMTQLALRLRTFDSSNVDMRVIPSYGQRIGGVSYVVSNEKQTKALFEAMRNRSVLPDYGRTGVSAVEPADIPISVLNGTNIDGFAKKVATELAAKGFPVEGTGQASPAAKTTVYYAEGNEEKAKVIAALFNAPMKVMPVTIDVTTPIAVVLGTDYSAGSATATSPPPPSPTASKGSKPAPAKPAPKPLTHAC